MNEKELKVFAAEIRLETARCVASRGFGHLGGALSIADALAVLYGGEMNIDPKNPEWDERDLLICSKGHAGPAVYATLALKGYFPMETLKTLNANGTTLPSHCDKNMTVGIDMTTGSLGQGLSLAVGMALGVKGTGRRVYAIIGDGEANEGQVWEALMFAAHRKLNNLVVLLDWNKKQLDGFTKDILDMGDFEQKLRAFGFNTQKVNGGSVAEIQSALLAARSSDAPSAVILDTVKGAGVPAIETMAGNHHVVFKDELAAESIKHLEAALAAIKEEI